MDAEAIRARIKEIIADVAGLDATTIGDKAHFVDELELDSLSLLEIGVEVDYEFKLGVSDERLKELGSVQDSVDLVLQVLQEKDAASGAS